MSEEEGGFLILKKKKETLKEQIINMVDDSSDSSSGDHQAEFIVGYVMLGICGVFLVISVFEIIGKTAYGLLKKKEVKEESTSSEDN